jgi:acyl-CoA hydrolase
MTVSNPPAKPVRESQVEMTELVLPNDANTFGNILGGKVMHLMDIAGAIAARRHTRRPVVTVEVDSLTFHYPIKVGNIIVLKASVNRAFRTSLEVGVKVFSEDTVSGEVKHTASAYLTFVALDKKGKPARVPPILPETAEEKRRYETAAERRKARLERKHRRSS